MHALRAPTCALEHCGGKKWKRRRAEF